MNWPRFLRCAMPVALLLLAGCYTVAERDGARIYTSVTWVPMALFLLGIALAWAGVQLLRGGKPQRDGSRQVLGALLAIVGPPLGIVVPFIMLQNKVIVDDRHFVVQDFFLWFEHDDVAYDGILAARIRSDARKHTLELAMKSGPARSIVVKNAFREAWPDVADRLRQRGFDLPLQVPG